MIKIIPYFLFIFSILFSDQIPSSLLSNSNYITGEDGVIRMYINVLGNVKSPGTYIVYDGIDFLTALSVAGGYMPGSDLSNITIYRKNGDTESINLNKLLKKELPVDEWINLGPHDTIHINQKLISKVLSTSNLTYTILGLLNLAITLDKN